MTFYPYGIDLGPLTVPFFGIVVIFAAVCGTLISRHVYQQMSGDDTRGWIWDAFLWALIPGVIGSRLYFVLTPSLSSINVGVDTAYYFSNPLEILSVWQGGLSLTGAVFGTMMGLALYAAKENKNALLLLDSAAVGGTFSQAVGRSANYFSQENYGLPAQGFLKVYISPENRLPGFGEISWYHPLFFYESIWDLLCLAGLVWLWKRKADKLLPGDLVLIYLAAYSAGRFIFEFWRLDYSPALGGNINQVIMIGIFFASAAMLFLRRKFRFTL